MVCVKKTVAAIGCETQPFSDATGTKTTGGINRGDEGAGGEGERRVERGRSAKPAGEAVGIAEGPSSQGSKGLVPREFDGRRRRKRRNFLKVRKA